MPSTTSIITKLKNKYPQFNFQPGSDFLWSSSENTIYYNANRTKDLPIFLLHELSHALIGHNKYDRDIRLITMERQAWDYTKDLALEFQINIPEGIIQSTLDSYRDWMHSRSTCPKCNATGIQVKKSEYSCPACRANWKVNEARTCNLKRYQIKK